MQHIVPWEGDEQILQKSAIINRARYKGQAKLENTTLATHHKHAERVPLAELGINVVIVGAQQHEQHLDAFHASLAKGRSQHAKLGAQLGTLLCRRNTRHQR